MSSSAKNEWAVSCVRLGDEQRQACAACSHIALVLYLSCAGLQLLQHKAYHVQHLCVYTSLMEPLQPGARRMSCRASSGAGSVSMVSSSQLRICSMTSGVIDSAPATIYPRSQTTVPRMQTTAEWCVRCLRMSCARSVHDFCRGCAGCLPTQVTHLLDAEITSTLLLHVHAVRQCR